MKKKSGSWLYILVVSGLIMVFALMLTTPAHAGNNGPGTPTCQGSTCSPEGADVGGGDVYNGGAGGSGVGIGVGVGVAGASSSVFLETKATNKSSSNSSATGGSSSSSSQSGSSTLNYNYTESDRGDTYKRYAPSVTAPSIGTTVPCLVPISGGVSVPTTGISFGSGVIDEECEVREVIRLGLVSEDPDTKLLANTALQKRLIDIVEDDREELATRNRDPEPYGFSDGQ